MEFRPNDYVVYPAHGVGQIISIEEQEIAGLSLELFVISQHVFVKQLLAAQTFPTQDTRKALHLLAILNAFHLSLHISFHIRRGHITVVGGIH